MDKLQMAHEMACAMMASNDGYTISGAMACAWEYADAMQAEWDSRINKGRPDVLQDEFQPTGYETPADKWQPDWSQAPKNMNYFFMNKDGSKYWAVNKPDKPNLTEHVMNFFESGGDCYSYATSQDYQGYWQDSLRIRP